MRILFFKEQPEFPQYVHSCFLSLLVFIFPSNKPAQASMNRGSEQPQAMYTSTQVPD